jgi:hypothetical protein
VRKREGLGTRIDEANSHNDTRSRNFEAAKLSDCGGLGVAAVFVTSPRQAEAFCFYCYMRNSGILWKFGSMMIKLKFTSAGRSILEANELDHDINDLTCVFTIK